MALTDSLVAWYRLADNAASTTVVAQDGNNGVTGGTNTSSISTTTDALSGNASGRCFDFTATDAKTVSATLDTTLTEFTVSVWVKMDDVTSAGTVCGTENGSGAKGFKIFFNAGNVAVDVNNNSENSRATWGSGVSTGVMYHIVIKYNATTKKSSIKVNNGSWVDAGTALTSAYVDNATLYIGKRAAGQIMDGRVQMLGIWNRILSDGEITSLYASGNGLDYPLTTSTNYPLTAALGTFTLTGVSTVVKSARKLVAAVGAFTLTGIAATLTKTLYERVIDSYNESNRNIDSPISDSQTAVGQAFTSYTQDVTLTKVKLMLNKVVVASGNVYAKIYASTGTYGVGAKPTGSVLATSDAVDSASLSTTSTLTTFNFSGAQQITLLGNTKYVVVIEPDTPPTFPNYFGVGLDNSSPTHAGNGSIYNSGSWGPLSTYDFIFYVYGYTNPSITIIIDALAFTLTGINSNLKLGIKLLASVGAFTLTGISNLLKLGTRLVASVGAFTLTGLTAILRRGIGISAFGGSFALSGSDIIFRNTLRMITSAGEFVLTGINAVLLKGYRIAAVTGEFVLTSVPASLLKALKLVAAVGTFTLTGVSAALNYGKTIAADAGSFILTGVDSNFRLGLKILAVVGTFTLSGAAAAISYGRILTASVGTFVLTGVSAIFTKALKLTAAVGSFALTGISAILSYGRKIVAAVGTFTLTGVSATFIKNISLIVSVGQFVLTGLPAVGLLNGVARIWVASSKSAVSTLANISKSTVATLSNTAKNVETWINQLKS